MLCIEKEVSCMKKWFIVLCIWLATFLPITASAALSSGMHSYGGGYHSSYSSGYRSYSSGFQRPSPSVTNPGTSYRTYGNYGGGYGYPSYGHSFWGGLGTGFFAGTLFSHLFHPFGFYGGYGFGFHPFSLLGDILIIGIVIWLVRRFIYRWY
jgi:hypothetical protein